MMKIGKVSEAVLNRSVLKEIKYKNECLENGPGSGCDASVIKIGGEYAAVSSNPVTVSCGLEAYIGISRVINDIAAKGAAPVAVTAVILVPADYDEYEIKLIMRRINECCAENEVLLAGGHTEVTPLVNAPCVTFTCIGNAGRHVPSVRPGQDVIMTDVAAVEGAYILTNYFKDDILKKYSLSYYDKCCVEKNSLFNWKTALTAIECGVSYVHNLSTGGVLNGLWELASFGNVGLDIDFKKIPVKQEIIEVCELFDLNPYQLASGGSFLMTSDSSYDIVNVLKKCGIMACRIGVTTDSSDRILRNEDEIRYLDTPKTDEIFKVL